MINRRDFKLHLAVIVLFIFFLGFITGVASNIYPNALLVVACEKELPRNKHCKLVAVPYEEKE